MTNPDEAPPTPDQPRPRSAAAKRRTAMMATAPVMMTRAIGFIHSTSLLRRMFLWSHEGQTTSTHLLGEL
jgi:hypothetical protein